MSDEAHHFVGNWMGIPYPPAYPLNEDANEREPTSPPALLALTEGESVLLIARVDASLKPAQYFFFNPSHPVTA